MREDRLRWLMLRVAQLPDRRLERHSYRGVGLMFEQRTQFDPRVTGWVPTSPCPRDELPRVPAPEGEQPAVAHQPLGQCFFGHLDPGAGGDLVQQRARHHSGLLKLQLLDYPS
jgi:hypothetical protein